MYLFFWILYLPQIISKVRLQLGFNGCWRAGFWMTFVRLMHLSHANSGPVEEHAADMGHDWSPAEGGQMIMALAEHAARWKRRPNCLNDNRRSFFYGSNIGGKSRGRIWGVRMHQWIADSCPRFRKLFWISGMLSCMSASLLFIIVSNSKTYLRQH